MTRTPSSVEQLSRLLTSTPDGLVVVDGEGTVRYANPAAHELFQRQPGSLVGEPFGLPHVSGARDIELRLADGSLRTVEMRAVDSTWEDERVWVLALRDTTEQRHREEELRESLLASTDLARELTHELSTPLAIIIGFADTLASHWDELDDPQRRDLTHRIAVQARRLHRMVRRMLLAGTAEGTVAGTGPEPVQLWEVALVHLPDLGIPSVEIDCPRQLRVLADPAHVDEIVVNLVENAAKYGAPPITVRARAVGDHVELTVCDRGPGVPEEFRPHLFERYARAEETMRKRSGSGLGLYLVRKLAEASGGTVRYRPNTPDGACFVVTLPSA